MFNKEINTPLSSDPLNSRIKKAVLFLIFFCFAVLLIQQFFRVIKHPKVDKLDGEVIIEPYPDLSVDSWFKGDFQRAANSYINQNFGFRNLFVRLSNQIRFSFFNKGVSKIVVGNGGHLFVSDYINGYYGSDFSGVSKINDTIQQLKLLNDELKSLGKTLLVILAPNKARVYPEFIPSNYHLSSKNNTNYDHLISGFKRSGINYIDFNEAYINKKNRSDYCLFSQLGIHWSRLEAVRAVDSIMGYLSFSTYWDMPRISIKKITTKDYLEFPDNDLQKVMNTLFTPDFERMGYPEFDFITENKIRKNALVVSDSYWADIYSMELPRNVFAVTEFWGPGRLNYGNAYFGGKLTKDRDIKRVLLQNDIIILVCSESNFSNFGFGFIGAAASAIKRSITPTANELNEIKQDILFKPERVQNIKLNASEKNISFDSMLVLDAIGTFHYNGPIIKKITIYDIKNEIKNNSTWLNEIAVKAKSSGISADSMLTLDAIWFYNSKLSKYEKEIKKFTLEEAITKIRNTPDWMNAIKEKAKAKKITIDSMLVLDAYWLMKENQQ